MIVKHIYLRSKLTKNKASNRNFHDIKSKSFLKSVNKLSPDISLRWLYCRASYISRLFSPINLFLRMPFWFSCIKKKLKQFLFYLQYMKRNFVGNIQEESWMAILRNSLGLFFFGIMFITPCFWFIESSPFSNPQLSDLIRNRPISLQKKPSGPG